MTDICRFCKQPFKTDERIQMRRTMNKTEITFAHDYDCLFVPVEVRTGGITVYKLKQITKYYMFCGPPDTTNFSPNLQL